MSFRVRKDGRLMEGLSRKERLQHYLTEFGRLFLSVRLRTDYNVLHEMVEATKFLNGHLLEEDRPLLNEVVLLRSGALDLSSIAPKWFEAVKEIRACCCDPKNEQNGWKRGTDLGEMYVTRCPGAEGFPYHRPMIMSYIEMLAEMRCGGYTEFGSPQAGDIVFDLGAFTGETAINFAYRVGDKGHVYAFEFVEPQLTLLKEMVNMPVYNELRNVTVVPLPCADVVNVPVGVSTQTFGAGARMCPDADVGGSDWPIERRHFAKRTTTIDDFVNNGGCMRPPSFIKMDIEGAEHCALKGAYNTLRMYKPRLAICLYHNIIDFDRIPRLILETNPTYKFRLGHYSPKGETETVLYAY
jgi:FkbM family methyltransferase